MGNGDRLPKITPERQIPVHVRSDVVKLLYDAGIKPSRRLGQNFLIDHNVLEVIAETCEIEEGEVVLEVGTGTGLLTEHLARRQPRRIFSVEIDSRLAILARKYLSGYENISVIDGSILYKGGLNRQLLAEITSNYNSVKVCGNLPYSVATPFICSILGESWFVFGVFVVQEEVAKRIIAEPATTEYSALSVIMREFAQVKLLRKIHPNCFYPVPDVYSRLIIVQPVCSPVEIGPFSQFVCDLFSQRRKNVSNFLKRVVPGKGLEERAKFFESVGIEATLRAQELTHQQILVLYKVLKENGLSY